MMQSGNNEIRTQKEQLDKYLKWQEEEGAIEYPVRLSTYLNEFQQKRLKWLKNHVVGSILEVGCSWGYVLAFVNGDAGVDIFEHNIALAKVLSPTKYFVVGDATTLPFDNKEYDTVILAEVLEHIPFENVHCAIEEALRVAKRKVLITLPMEKHLAQSFKHKWIVTNDTINQLRDWSGDDHLYVADGYFTYMELRV